MSEAATSLDQVRKRQLASIRLSSEILGHIVSGLSEAEAHAKRDGADGWSIVEIVCHLRDFDAIFRGRAQMMLDEDYPQLPAYDHEAMAIERDYQSESAAAAYAQLSQSRRDFIAFFKALSEEQWARAGVHPEKGHFTLTDALMQVALHDLDHLEQITRVLAN